MFSKSMTLTAAVVVVGVAVPATTLASPVGAGAPASGDDQPVQALPFSDAVVSANTANEHRAQTLPFSDAVVSADAPQALPRLGHRSSCRSVTRRSPPK
jgi:hypothetical protein